MKKINTSQSKRTSFLIWLMFLGGVLISMPVKAQSTVSELQQLINEVPVNGTKVLDLGGKTYQQLGKLEITGGRNITLKNGTLKQANSSTGTFISLNIGSLTLEDVIVDGQGDLSKISVAPLITLNNSEMFIKAGTQIKGNSIKYNDFGAVSGIKVDSYSSLTVTGGSMWGYHDNMADAILIEKGGRLTITGGQISAIRTKSNDVVIGDAALISPYIRLDDGVHLKLSSAIQNKLSVWKLGTDPQNGTIAAVGYGSYIPTINDAEKFESYNNFGGPWHFELKDKSIVFSNLPSSVNTEDELQKRIDTAPVGSTGSPTSISIGNVEITKGVTINGKYITLTGGNIIGNSNNAWISLKGGGLNLDQIKITNKGAYNCSPIYVDG